MSEVNNGRIARNAVALALRMILVITIGLYTSRVVLRELGFDDYGIYGVVAGVISMASFLNVSMASATSRFLTFELGRGDRDKLRDVFSTALIIHLCLAVAVLLLAETVGLWFVNNKLVIPPDRMEAANWVYQFSVLSILVGFTQVPYNAILFAHEEMGIYAKAETINVALKLGIVYLLGILAGDSLIWYAGMILIVTAGMAMFYRIYCIRRFPESRFRFVWKKDLWRPMLGFSGFDLFNSFCFSIKEQGITVLINMFIGLTANAASGIAYTINGAVSSLANTIGQAFKPQIIKQYSIGDIAQMSRLMVRSVSMTWLMLACLLIPCTICLPEILTLWLGEYPDLTVAYGRTILLTMFVSITAVNAQYAIHATGKIRNLSLVNSSLLLSNLLIVYLALKADILPISGVYCVQLFTGTLMSCYGYRAVKRQIPGFDAKLMAQRLTKTALVITASGCASFYLSGRLATDLSETTLILNKVACVVLFNTVLLSGLSYVIALDRPMRCFVKDRVISSLQTLKNHVDRTIRDIVS